MSMYNETFDLILFMISFKLNHLYFLKVFQNLINLMLCGAPNSLVHFMLEHNNYRCHYRYYNSAPNNSYMFQFTAPCGLKHTVVISLLKFILIE